MTTKGLAIARVLLFYGLSTLFFIAATALTTKVASNLKDQLSMVLAILVTFLLIVLFSRMENMSLKAVGVIPGKASLSRFFGGYLIGLAMAFGQASIVMGFGHFQLKPVVHLSIIPILSSFLLFLLAALREELVFRSYALTRLKVSLGPTACMSIITVIFILEHVATGMPLVTAIVGSGMGALLFCYAALRTKGLALPLGLHGAWNFGQWMLGFKGRPGIWQAMTDHAFAAQVQTIGLAAFVLVIAVSIIGIHYFYKSKMQKTMVSTDEAA
ncbi:MAG: type II CAAX endopeptidase family protein [Bacteroidota bacterium]